LRNVSDKTWWFIALLATVLPESCRAENAANFLHFGPGALFIIGAVCGLPSAILCVLAEAIFPRRRLPRWLTGLSVASTAVAIAVLVFAVKAAAQQRADSQLFLLFIVPALVALALRGTVTTSSHRLVSGWVIAVAAFGLAASRYAGSEAATVLAGGATACLLFWTVTILILSARRVRPPESAHSAGKTPIASRSAAFDRLAGVGAAVFRALPLGRIGSWSEQNLARLKPAQAGLIWWFASSCVLYVGIGVAIAAGKLGGGSWLYVEWQYVADLFGLRYPKEFRPTHAWWVFGLPWSLFAGSAFWGLAGLLGAFDPGRARIARLAAIVFGGALLAWTASIIDQIAETDARERKASEVYR